MKNDPAIRLIIKIIIIAAAIWAVLTFIVAIRVIHTNEMYPAVRDGQLVIFSRISKPLYEKVVLYKTDGQEHIGRVIAQSGDRVEISNEQGLMVNDSVIYNTLPYKTEAGESDYPVTVGDDEVYILIDDRELLTDSRTYGAIKKEDIVGVAVFALQYRGF